MICLDAFVIFVESLGTFIQTVSNCKLLNEQISQNHAQDLMVLIGELVKTLNLHSNPGVGHHSNLKNNSNARVASKYHKIPLINFHEREIEHTSLCGRL